MKPWYEPIQDRPDIPKNAPKKRGIIRFFEALWREFFELIKLNLLFCLSCVPLVTIPAAITALSCITVTMTQDKNHFLWPDYWKAFRRDFGKSLAGGIILMAVMGGVATGTRFYYMLIAHSRLFVILAAAAACLLVSTVMAGLYFFPMLACVDLPLMALLKNSFILTFINIKRSLPALLLTLLFYVLGIGLLPYSAPFAALFMFSLVSLISSFLIYPVIEKRVILSGERLEERADGKKLQSVQPGGFSEPGSASLGESVPELYGFIGDVPEDKR